MKVRMLMSLSSHRNTLGACAAVLGLAGACVIGPRAAAETPVGLKIELHSGITITGVVGSVYSAMYVTDLSPTNIPNAWRCLEYLQLPASPYVWTDGSAPASERRFYRVSDFEAPTNMVFIPPGRFRLGSSTNDPDFHANEGPQTDVIISRGFWMGKYEVTQGEFQSVMGSNPSFFNGVKVGTLDGKPVATNDYGIDLARPVETVTWHEASSYCARLTELERAAGRIAANSLYRLPTEAEWEYACRAWTSTRFSYGDDPGYTRLPNYAWHCPLGYCSTFTVQGTTHPVGDALPNLWDLYDMHGNVWEWCQDYWSHNLPGGTTLNPQGPLAGPSRVKRGGSWMDKGEFCRSAVRSSEMPSHGDAHIGFRVVLASE